MNGSHRASFGIEDNPLRELQSVLRRRARWRLIQVLALVIATIVLLIIFRYLDMLPKWPFIVMTWTNAVLALVIVLRLLTPRPKISPSVRKPS